MRSFALMTFLLLAADAPAPKDDTLGARPPEGAVVLFDGKDLSGWVRHDGSPAKWPVEDGILIVGTGQGDIRTERTFGDFKLHLEFQCPYMPDARGQARGNSGVYLGGIYELQVLDSFGIDPIRNNDCGAIYSHIAPKVNACKPPLRWQTYDVTFRKAKAEDGKVVRRARVTVVQNGITIIDDQETPPTPGGAGNKEGEPGPLLLQDHGNKVQYRNIWLVEVE